MATKSVSVRIPEESLKELERIATLKGQKVSDVVRDLIVERLTNGSGGGNQLISATAPVDTVPKSTAEITARRSRVNINLGQYNVGDLITTRRMVRNSLLFNHKPLASSRLEQSD